MDGENFYENRQRNVLGRQPAILLYGADDRFFRDGCCHTGPQDAGSHTVCSIMTEEFLAFSKSVGNDLSTPRPEFDFAGLRAGTDGVYVRQDGSNPDCQVPPQKLC